MLPTHPKLGTAGTVHGGAGTTGSSEASLAAAAPPTKSNRGPAAAAANRDALLVAARHLFAERGLNVPLNAIAQEAGVGQGVLYRHFPSRIDLALAVFEENVAKIVHAARAADHPENRFAVTWRQMVDLTVSDVAFIETVMESARDPRIDALFDELRSFLDPLVAEARACGTLSERMNLDALFAALRASYGLVKTHLMAETSARQEVEELLTKLGVPTGHNTRDTSLPTPTDQLGDASHGPSPRISSR